MKQSEEQTEGCRGRGKYNGKQEREGWRERENERGKQKPVKQEEHRGNVVGDSEMDRIERSVKKVAGIGGFDFLNLENHYLVTAITEAKFSSSDESF